MSISSCRFNCQTFYADVLHKKHTVEINFESSNFGSSSTLQVGTTIHTAPHVVNVDNNAYPLNDGAGNIVFNNTTNYIGTNIDQFRIVGYKLFFLDGYLKCVKKEVSLHGLVTYTYSTAASVTSPATGLPQSLKRPIREVFVHPSLIWDTIQDPSCRKYIQDRVLGLASKYDIFVPKEFKDDGDQPDAIPGIQYVPGYRAALDWLAYPLVREIKSAIICRNMTHRDRNFISPKFKAMNFKDLVEHYYGTSTSKLLEELWEVITTGTDYHKTTFEVTPECPSNTLRDQFLANYNQNLINPNQYPSPASDILETGTDYVIQIGNKRVNSLAFTLGPSILKVMGFDYFYQIVSKLNTAKSIEAEVGMLDSTHGAYGSIESDLRTILKSVSPKKLLNALFPENFGPHLHLLHDTTQMIREYEDPLKIPRQLKLQYPLGLVVDFRFKTLKELHDKISTQYTIIKAESTKKEIPVAPIYMGLDGRQHGGCKLVVPTNTSMLAIWGKLLNICVASYGDRAVNGSTLLLGVEKEGVIKYCIEFRSIILNKPKIEQLVGLFNPSDRPEPMIEAETIRETYPRLLEKHLGITPTDLEEDGTYHIPFITQFRSERNGDPTPEDRGIVENMLIEWTKENFEFLSTIDHIFDTNGPYGYSMDGAQINQAVLQNAINYAHVNQGQPVQMIIPAAQHDALFNIYRNGVNENAQAPNGPIIFQGVVN